MPPFANIFANELFTTTKKQGGTKWHHLKLNPIQKGIVTYLTNVNFLAFSKIRGISLGSGASGIGDVILF